MTIQGIDYLLVTDTLDFENLRAIAADPEAFKAFKSRMDRAFDIVADPSDARAPIKVTATTALMEKLLKLTGFTVTDLATAVRFHTSTDLEMVVTGDTITLTAVGYRAGPAGP